MGFYEEELRRSEEGRGYTRIDEESFDWEEDIVYIPLNTGHQHFNVDSSKPARLISATNRMFKYMGYHDLEQVEDAPKL